MHLMRAPCGIDCEQCDIYKAARHPAEAEKLAETWRATWQPKAQADWFKCQGCRGDRSLCWSEDCKIFECVSAKGVPFCYQCADFPCELLSNWSRGTANHQAAFDWLEANGAH